MEHTAERRPCAEQIEKVGRRSRQVEDDHIASVHERLRPHEVVYPRHASEDRAEARDLREVGPRHVEVPAAPVERVHDDHAVLPCDRQSIDEDGLEDREHCGRHTDAQRKERQDGNREPWRTLERTQGMAHVADEGVHERYHGSFLTKRGRTGMRRTLSITVAAC
jgi:hypothetical protein